MTDAKPGKPLRWLLNWIWSRVSPQRNKDVFWLVVGDPGNGKSTWMFLVACLLDRLFGAHRCAWSLPRFIALANDAENIPPASVIMVDEGIVGGHRRDAMSRPNRDASKFLSVFRYRRLITLVGIPFLKDVDASMVRRAHLLSVIESRTVNGRDVVEAKTFMRARTRHFSKKDPGWQWIGTYPFGPVSRDHPKYEEWDAIQNRKDSAVQRFRGGMDGGYQDADLEAEWRLKARKILLAEGVKLAE